MKTTDIKTFPDYRLYIVARLQALQLKNPAFTVSAFAKALGLKDQSSISKIISGKRNPGFKITQKLINFFKLDSKESEYFQTLIEMSKSKTNPVVVKYLNEKLNSKVELTKPSIYNKHLTDEKFFLISHWYSLAILEMTNIKKLKLIPKKIAELLIDKVKLRDISKAILGLQKVGLININSDGFVSHNNSHFISTEDIPSEAIKQYHESVLILAMKILRLVPPEERDYSATTLAVKKEQIAAAQKKLREFRESFIREFQSDSPDTVYQFQFQLYPLTNNSKGVNHEEH